MCEYVYIHVHVYICFLRLICRSVYIDEHVYMLLTTQHARHRLMGDYASPKIRRKINKYDYNLQARICDAVL